MSRHRRKRVRRCKIAAAKRDVRERQKFARTFVEVARTWARMNEKDPQE